MNLRKKIKKAKKEIKEVEEQYTGNTTFDIVMRYKKTSKLQKIINYKRNDNRFYQWNEGYEIDWNKLTYFGFNAGFTNLGYLKSANGKALTRTEINKFLKVIMDKFYQYAKQVSGEEASEGDFRKHVDYSIIVSNDRTKGKRLHVEKRYFQFKGSDLIYEYGK